MEKIVIIGSANTDLIVRTDRIPRPGETVLGGEFRIVSGGKGANQAVAVSRLGGDALFVARIGEDMFGDQLMEQYASERMDTSYIIRDAQAFSGVALISVDAAAENCIVVAPGANSRLSIADIDRVKPELAKAGYLLIQLEIPLETVAYAIRTAVELGVKVILNPAPAAQLDDELLKYIYLITPNETECALLTGRPVSDQEEAVSAAAALLRKGVENVVVTCGSRGSVIKNARVSEVVPACRVQAVDTTAAGDVFNGALVVALAEGRDLRNAVRFATHAAALSVTRVGAQSSVPTRKEVDALMNENDPAKESQP
ncbi:ribokinase [uncultured Alistipes sp.]|jgi:ribokinase|uniref:ribokinase n=1 Tax=uncultured Alistipes sp. TaxID=538949 RepID=UPI0025EF2540|nr:ribokinase [uncultured Alistipes sp.]